MGIAGNNVQLMKENMPRYIDWDDFKVWLEENHPSETDEVMQDILNSDGNPKEFKDKTLDFLITFFKQYSLI